jgi:hypothetical protein
MEDHGWFFQQQAVQEQDLARWIGMPGSASAVMTQDPQRGQALLVNQAKAMVWVLHGIGAAEHPEIACPDIRAPRSQRCGIGMAIFELLDIEVVDERVIAIGINDDQAGLPGRTDRLGSLSPVRALHLGAHLNGDKDTSKEQAGKPGPPSARAPRISAAKAKCAKKENRGNGCDQIARSNEIPDSCQRR